MKVAAIYARKSTGQHVGEDDKSVTRQVENAKAFALAQGGDRVGSFTRL